ncbi:hypothetical protein AB0C24_18025 [Amycolatopsis japonica]|uniref:hypothetical protein n=1 Tax=Amycolatopsis japonica TaxID=208439 RepID=UPI0033CBA9FC
MYAGLTERIEANFAEHACHLHRRADGMTVTETDDLVIADSGIEGDAGIFNVVANARFAPDIPFGSVELTAGQREAAMCARVADLSGAGPHPDLEIRRVRTPEELADYARILAAGWNPPAATVVEFYDRVAPAALTDDCPAHYLIGYHHGEPVSAGEIFLHAEVAGIHDRRRESRPRTGSLASLRESVGRGGLQTRAPQ